MNSKVLFAFADNVRNVIAIAIVFTLVLGALGSLVIARNLAHPVELLYHEVVDGQEKKQFPQLSHTNIRELDRLADALTSLNSELLNNSTKFCASWTWPVWSWAAMSCGSTRQCVCYR